MYEPRIMAANLAGQGKDSVRAAIGRAADRTGVDFGYLLNQAKTESGLDPGAKAATSSASGLFQFIDQSWLGVVKSHGAKHGFGWAAEAIQRRPGGGWRVDPALRQAVFGLRDQAGPAALMAGEFASDNAEGLTRALGRTPSSTDLYFAHFLGLEGATRFLKAAGANPDSAAAAAFPREARANRAIFYSRTGEARSLGQVYALIAKKIGGGDAAPPATEPGSRMQLAYAKEVFDEPGEKAPDVTERLTTRFDILRPNPQQARLAYLMLSRTNI